LLKNQFTGCSLPPFQLSHNFQRFLLMFELGK